MQIYKIYLITNLTKQTNNKYVGQTVKSIEDRFAEHVYQANHLDVLHYDVALHRAMAKDGIENFKLELLEDNISEDDIDSKEIYYIAKYDSYNHGYNETKGGQGIHGYSHTDQTKQKISKHSLEMWDYLRANPEKLHERNSKISAAQLGVKKSDDQRKKLSEAASKRTGSKNSFFGKHHTEAAKAKIGEANSIEIEAYDKNNNFIKSFESAAAAIKWLNDLEITKNTNAAFIIKCCKGKVKFAYGFIWKYKVKCND